MHLDLGVPQLGLGDPHALSGVEVIGQDLGCTVKSNFRYWLEATSRRCGEVRRHSHEDVNPRQALRLVVQKLYGRSMVTIRGLSIRL